MADAPKPGSVFLRLLINDRFWLLCFSGLLSLFAWASVWLLVPAGELRVIRLEQIYGFIAVTYLYFALLASPLAKAFPTMPGKEKYLFLRRAIGVSSFYFGALHAGLSFFGQLQGFTGLEFLNAKYKLALILGVLALMILLALASTSIDKIIDIMTFPRWKRLHRLIYAAGWLVFFHAVLIGTHFSGSNTLPGRIVFVAVIFLLLLEAVRIDRLLKERVSRLRHFGVASMIVIHILFVGFGYIIGRSSSIRINEVHGHGAGGGNQDLKQEVAGGQQIEINQLRFNLNDVLEDKQTIAFRVQPGFDYKQLDCFLINLDTHAYIQGKATIWPDGTVRCSLDGSNELVAGGYSVYIRLTNEAQNIATKFDVDIQ